MIKINLIPAKRKKKPKHVPPFIIAMILLLIVSGVASAYAVYYMDSKVQDLELKKKVNVGKIAKLDKRIREVKDFEKLNQSFLKRKKIIEELTKSQSVPVRVLDEMSRRLTDGIWLVSMKISATGVTISGVGFSNTDIVSFVQNLKVSALFENVVLGGTQLKKSGTVETYTFNIRLNIKKA